MTPIITVTQTLNPTTTISVTAGVPLDTDQDPSDASGDAAPTGPFPSITSIPGPFVSAGGPDGSVPSATDDSGIFTTVTIDIWGTISQDSDSDEDESDDGSGPVDSQTFTAAPQAGDPGNAGGFPTGGPWDAPYNPSQEVSDQAPISTSGRNWGSSPTAYGDDAGTWQQSGALPMNTGADSQNDGHPWETVVTDTDIFWTSGPDGLSQVTIWSTHTLALEGSPTGGSADYGSGPGGPVEDGSDSDIPTTKTIIGPDGKSTVIIEAPDGSGSDQAAPSGLSASDHEPLSQVPVTDGGVLPSPSSDGRSGGLP